MDILKLLNQPGWDYRLTHQGINIKAPSKEAANSLAEIYAECLLETAAKIHGKVRVGWRRCKQPIEFFGWMATRQGEPTPAEMAEHLLNREGKGVFCSQLYQPTPLLRRMVVAGESDRPISITRHSDKKLIIINQLMEQLLETPAAIATQRIVSDYWRPADFAELQRKYRIEGHFRWQYDAALNQSVWAILETEFERFEVDGQWYGQNIILIEPEPVPFPTDIAVPV